MIFLLSSCNYSSYFVGKEINPRSNVLKILNISAFLCNWRIWNNNEQTSIFFYARIFFISFNRMLRKEKSSINIHAVEPKSCRGYMHIKHKSWIHSCGYQCGSAHQATAWDTCIPFQQRFASQLLCFQSSSPVCLGRQRKPAQGKQAAFIISSQSFRLLSVTDAMNDTKRM